MNVEIWDLYDAQGEKTGKTMIRGEAIPVAVPWAFNGSRAFGL